MKVFISYRRDDSAGYAGRLFEHLAAHFGMRNVFMDIDTIEPGEDFRKVVQDAVGTCDVVLVMIGLFMKIHRRTRRCLPGRACRSMERLQREAVERWSN